MAESDLLPDLRDAIDEALAREGWVMRDEDGHVSVFDGDVDTADMGQSLIDLLLEKGWAFKYVH